MTRSSDTLTGGVVERPLVSTSLTTVSMQGVPEETAGTYTVGTGDPTQRGIQALRDAGLDPLRLWSLKAPKDAGGTVSAVFLQAKAEIVFLHQLSSGRYVLFEKSTLAAVSGALVEEGE